MVIRVVDIANKKTKVEREREHDKKPKDHFLKIHETTPCDGDGFILADVIKLGIHPSPSISRMPLRCYFCALIAQK